MWSFGRQYALQEMAKIYEDQKDYDKAIIALNRWIIREPCGTGAAGSGIRRWSWLLRLRTRNGEDRASLKGEVWQSIGAESFGLSMNQGIAVEAICELYSNDLAALMADARAVSAKIDSLEQSKAGALDSFSLNYHKESITTIIQEVALKMRLAGPAWCMSENDARKKQLEQSQSYNLPIEKVININGSSMVFRLIPAGEFLIGSPPDESSRISPDENQDRVRISVPFYIGKYEVTQMQWQSIMGSNPSQIVNTQNSARHPVDSVSWDAITKQFLPKIQEFSPKGMCFDLPSEAQWEYACRAGTNTRFYFGETITTELANIGDERAKGWQGHTLPVGSYGANAWGLHDMHGNVAEWCKDAFSYNFYRSHNKVAVNPLNSEGPNRVTRGGDYSSSPERVRSACRSSRGSDHGASIGFRLVMAIHGIAKLGSE
jgi:formylglycine-generating enzyme required for sulfatase activity